MKTSHFRERKAEFNSPIVNTVILSNLRRTRTVPKPYRTKLKLFFKNLLGTFDVPYYRTIIKKLELFRKNTIN